MKKILHPLIKVCLVLAITACSTKYEDLNMSYDEVKTKSYASMSASEKEFFISELTERLAKDKNYRIREELFEKQATAIKNRDRTAGEFSQERSPNIMDAKASIQFYSERGIKDAEGFVRNQLKIYLASLVIAKYYPELQKLDAETQKRVFKETNEIIN